MKINTVNVVELFGNKQITIKSFTETLNGNEETIKLFTEIVKENGAQDNWIDFYIENGYFEYGDYKAFIIHSN